MSTANPFEEIEVAVRRADPDKPDGAVMLPDEKLPLPEAIAAFTINAAYVNGMEHETGSIESGKAADLVVIDRDLSIPVQNTRTGARSVAFGDATAHGAGMELRFMGANADLREGDLLATSGVDGVYPAGVPVARIDRIERRADSAFARIYCMPLATVSGARYVLVLAPVGQQALRPAPQSGDPLAVTKKKEKDKEKADKAKGKGKAEKPTDKPSDKPADKAPEAAAPKPATQAAPQKPGGQQQSAPKPGAAAASKPEGRSP